MTGLLALSIGARHGVGDAVGLMAEHYANAGFLKPAVHTAIEQDVTAEGVIRAWNGAPPENLSAAWSGWIYIYKLAFTACSIVPWAWLPGMIPVLLGDRTGPVLSNLRHVNPRMEVFRRESVVE